MEKVSQSTAVRLALTELGMESDNKAIVEWIKSKYDIDVGANISQVKSKVKKDMMQALQPKQPVLQTTQTIYTPMVSSPPRQPSPQIPSSNSDSKPVSLADVKTMATLLKRYGKSGVDDIIELLDEVAE